MTPNVYYFNTLKPKLTQINFIIFPAHISTARSATGPAAAATAMSPGNRLGVLVAGLPRRSIVLGGLRRQQRESHGPVPTAT